MPCHWSLCFLVSPCYLQNAMPCQWSSSDLPRMLQIWESVFYSQTFFYLTLLSAEFKDSLAAAGSALKLAGLHADLRSITPARLFVWITTIHKRGIVAGLRITAGQLMKNLPLTEFELFHNKWACQKTHALSFRSLSHAVRVKLRL